jgi:hypothetical protein
LPCSLPEAQIVVARFTSGLLTARHFDRREEGRLGAGGSAAAREGRVAAEP